MPTRPYALLLACLLGGCRWNLWGQVAPGFEALSIRPCNEVDFLTGRQNRVGAISASPGRLHIDCQTVQGLISVAYLLGNGQLNQERRPPVSGGPPWISVQRYTIDAKAGDGATAGMIVGPMLQAILKDRFKLRLHKETRDVPVYAFTIAKGGPRLRQVPSSPDQRAVTTSPHYGRKGPNLTMECSATTLEEFAKSLGGNLEFPVVDRTKIKGTFEIRLEFVPDEETSPAFLNILRTQSDPSPEMPPGPPLFLAIQEQLGLKLSRGRGQREYLVVDRVAMPFPD